MIGVYPVGLKVRDSEASIDVGYDDVLPRGYLGLHECRDQIVVSSNNGVSIAQV